jgi:hypothetical protein
MIKLSKVKRTGNLVPTNEKRNAEKCMSEKLERNGTVIRPSNKRKDNNKMDLK